ncbi:MAG: sucrase ferredoxin [Acidimicrobiales bacterium]
MSEPRCSAISRDLGEDLHATASIVRSWVLVEQPGPWGAEAVTQSDLAAEVAGPLVRGASRHGVRVLLVRRPDRADRSEAAGRRCFVIHAVRGRTWVERRTLADPSELAAIDLARLAAGQRLGFGLPHEGALYLVCTNGRHDPCCAQLGRPVVRALLDPGGEAVWECSHVGGDRFAGNVVALPDGLYFGRLGPDDARRAVDAHRAGRIQLEHYRGRAGDPLVVQAADWHVRAATGLVGVGDLVPIGRHQVGPGLVDVRFAAADGRRLEARVAVAPSPAPRPLTCVARNQGQPPRYTCVWVRTA